MTSEFVVHDAAGYEQLMGRLSKKLAPLFIGFFGVKNGEKVRLRYRQPDLRAREGRRRRRDYRDRLFVGLCRGSDPA